MSNLFTTEYWRLAADHLRDDGLFCQWVQLYALPPRALRGLVRSFLDVFPHTWLYETIPGADALLLTGPPPPGAAPPPTLSPDQLRALAGRAPRNTDDMPWIELEAPRWLHRSTGALNRALLEEAAARERRAAPGSTPAGPAGARRTDDAGEAAR